MKKFFVSFICLMLCANIFARDVFSSYCDRGYFYVVGEVSKTDLNDILSKKGLHYQVAAIIAHELYEKSNDVQVFHAKPNKNRIKSVSKSSGIIFSSLDYINHSVSIPAMISRFESNTLSILIDERNELLDTLTLSWDDTDRIKFVYFGRANESH